jgi:pimeloyl-ACP methyl ester carboxylesterase
VNDKLLVFGPGFADPNLVIDQLAKKFGEGFDRIVLSYPERGTRQTIDATCEGLYRPLAILRKSYKFVAFIGHSMGGLVGRRLMDMHYPNKLFDAYVSIATPHNGTGLALLAPGSLLERLSPSARDMRPGSLFLNHLTENRAYLFDEGYPAYTPAMTLAAGFDELVWPRSSTRIEGVDNHVVIPWTNHITVALSDRSFGEIYSWLKFEVLNESPTKEGEPGTKQRMGRSK